MQEYRTRELYGDFYENTGKPLVVIIGGSRPGLPAPLSPRLLEYLKSNYSLLLLAYFGVGELPERLEAVPMEYFVNSIDLIREKYGIAPERTAVIGQSKGGEAALVLTKYLRSAVTIALVASCYVFQGIPSGPEAFKAAAGRSSWTYGGRELPFIPFYYDSEVVRELKAQKYRSCYELSIQHNYNPDAIINIRDYPGKLLFISEENDAYWPSRDMMDQLIENCSDRSRTEHVVIDLEGHYLLSYEESVEKIIDYLDEVHL